MKKTILFLLLSAAYFTATAQPNIRAATRWTMTNGDTVFSKTAADLATYVSAAIGGGGASDALGTGFTAGGGSGTIPNGTIASLPAGGLFDINYSNATPAIEINDDEGYVNIKDFGGDANLAFSGGNFTINGNSISMGADGANKTLTIGPDGFDFGSTTGALVPPRMTTAERDALTASDGWTIYNLDSHREEIYNGTYWASQPLHGTLSATGTATTTFTVTIGATMPNTTYTATFEGSNTLSGAAHYVNNWTTTTFDVVYLAGLTGAVAGRWAVIP